MSAIAAQARSRDRNCPCHRYAPERGGPRPVLHRRGHPGRRVRPGHRPAPAAPADHLVLGDLGPHRRDLRHLPPDHPRLRRPVQAPPHPAAAGRHVPDHASGRSLSCIVAPGCPFGLPGFRPVFLRSDFGAGFASPSDDGGLRGVLRVLPQPRGQIRDLRLKARHLLPQPRASASCARSPAISASRSASSSRSRAFAARSPAHHQAHRAYGTRAAGCHSRPPVINATRQATQPKPATTSARQPAQKSRGRPI